MTRVPTRVTPPSWYNASRSAASKASLNLDWSLPLSASPNSLNHGLQVRMMKASKVHLQTCTIMGSKCFSALTCSCSPTASPQLLDYGRQVHLWVLSLSASKCISNLALLHLPSASLSLLALGLQVHRHTRSRMAPKYHSQDQGVGKRLNSHVIKGEFVKMCPSGLRIVDRGCEDMKGYPAVTNHTNHKDQWRLGKCAWGTTQAA